MVKAKKHLFRRQKCNGILAAALYKVPAAALDCRPRRHPTAPRKDLLLRRLPDVRLGAPAKE